MINNEKNGWKAFGVKIKTIKINTDLDSDEYRSRHKQSLILPFCFTFNEDTNNFDFSFSYLKSISDFYSYVPNEIKTISKSYSINKDIILKELVKSLKVKNIIYTDKECRHIGLMPKRINGKIHFQEVLIDHAMNKTTQSIQVSIDSKDVNLRRSSRIKSKTKENLVK